MGRCSNRCHQFQDETFIRASDSKRLIWIACIAADFHVTQSTRRYFGQQHKTVPINCIFIKLSSYCVSVMMLSVSRNANAHIFRIIRSIDSSKKCASFAPKGCENHVIKMHSLGFQPHQTCTRGHSICLAARTKSRNAMSLSLKMANFKLRPTMIIALPLYPIYHH